MTILRRVSATLNGAAPAIAAAGDYAALDVLNDSASAGHVGVLPVRAYSGLILKVVMTLSVAAATPRLRLFFFSSIPTVLQNDNAAFLLDADDRGAYLGYMDLPALSTSGSSEISWAQTTDPFSFACASGDPHLYFVVQTLDAFTNESAGMTATLTATIDPD